MLANAISPRGDDINVLHPEKSLPVFTEIISVRPRFCANARDRARALENHGACAKVISQLNLSKKRLRARTHSQG